MDAHTNPGDYMNDSIWAKGVTLPAFPKLEQNLKTEVLIIGGGLTGLLCAWQLQQAGVDYVLVEADAIMHGTSRNTTAKLTSQHGFLYHKLLRRFGPEKARQYYLANEAALAGYREMARSIDCDFETQDNYIYATASTKDLDAEWAALRQLHIPAEKCSSLPLPFPVSGAIRFPAQAQFHPLKFAAQIAKGLNIREHTAVKAHDGTGFLTDSGRIAASKDIVATHFPIFNKHGLYFLKQYQQRSYVLALEHGPKLDGMYLDSAKNGISLRNHGDMLLLGGGGHRTGKQGGGWAELERFARQHFPESREVCRWAAQDCMTLDGIPYIGRYCTGTPNLYVATGFNKWGMTTAMAAATLLADLVQGRHNPSEALFDPSRSVLRPQLAVNALEATVNLLTPTKPRCPHMGCALKWNPAERSWDCPCHGSRFTADGKLLDNPASGDLK